MRPPGPEQLERAAAELAADAVEHERRLAPPSCSTHRRRPSPAGRSRRRRRRRAPRRAPTLSGPPASPTTVAPAWRAAWTNSVPSPPAAAVTTTTSSAAQRRRGRAPPSPCGRCRSAPPPRRCVEAVGHRPQRADRHDGLRRVATAGRAEVGDDALPEPRSGRRRRRARRPRRRPRDPASSAAAASGNGPPARRAGSTCRGGGRRPPRRRCAPGQGRDGGRGASSSAEDVGGTELVLTDRLHALDGTSFEFARGQGRAACHGGADGRATGYGPPCAADGDDVAGRSTAARCCASPSARASSTVRTCRCDTDTIIAEALAAGLAAPAPDVVVGPSLTVTASGEHAGFPGTLSIGTDATADGDRRARPLGRLGGRRRARQRPRRQPRRRRRGR